MRIGNREVGPGQPVLVVAELGGNVAHDWVRAANLVTAAKAAGADAVKTQCFRPATMTLPGDDAAHRITWTGRERTLYDLYCETALPLDWHARLMGLCAELGLLYFASEFSPADVDFMQRLGAPCHKCASFEITDLPLLRAMNDTGKPVIISTGMATREEIHEAAESIGWRAHRDGPILLKCTSAYPAAVTDTNLETMKSLYQWTDYVGLSDHSRSNTVVAAAVALGACVVERHLTLTRADGGPDAAFSDEPDEFAAMVRAVRETTAALGSVRYGPTASEAPNLRLRRSLWVTQDIAAGESFTPANVASLRPLGGLPPAELPHVLGRRAGRDYRRGEALTGV